MTDAARMRVRHEERERLVHVLMQQYAEGRLTAAELDELSGRARLARTYADLDRLVVDLPVTLPCAVLRQTATTEILSRLGTDPDHRQTLSGGMSSHVQRGVWTVPAYLNLNAGMATVGLHFQQAVCPHEVVDTSVSGGVGAVVLVVPEGWAVNTDHVGKGIGSCRTSRHDPAARQAAAGAARQLGGGVGEDPGPEPARPVQDAAQPQPRW